MPQYVALLLTLLIEAPVAVVLMRILGWGSAGRAALAAVAGVMATHVLAWPAILRLESVIAYLAAVAAVEIVVVLAKSVIYRGLVPLAWRRALVLALVANSASTGFGLGYYAVASRPDAQPPSSSSNSGISIQACTIAASA